MSGSSKTIKAAKKSFTKKVNKTDAYKLWINYDGDLQPHSLPVLPEDIKVTVKGETTSVTIDQLGEVLFKGKRDAITVSFSSFFPPEWSRSYCSCSKKEFYSPTNWHNWLIDLMESVKPAHLVLTGSPFQLNIYADVTQYKPEERGGDPGTIYYSIELKEHREPQIRVYKKSTSSSKKKKAKVTTKKKRTSNKVNSRTYTVKSGDCLWNIAKKYYGNGAQYTKIYNANKSKISNPNLIYPGQVLTIP